VKLAGGAHLTYCTNIHPGETLAEVRDVVATHVAAVKRRLCPDASFGVGLRLSARASEELAASGALEAFADLLRARDLYVFTINGFPYGSFHAARVKEQVYEPDWRTDERATYTDRLAAQLAALLPDGVEGSVSTLPGGFRPRVEDREAQTRVARGIARHAAWLAALRERTGKTIRLAIEPEPYCMIETVAEAVAFFEERLCARGELEKLAEVIGATTGRAEAMLREHVGVCFDACHSAVVFEDPREAVRALERAGIRIAKMQVTTALEANADAEGRDALARFADDVYLHQVFARGGDRTERHLDLPEALARSPPPRDAGVMRVHFHVPVFCEGFGALRSTQADLREALDAVRGKTTHFEVETYTWDVIPEAHRPAERTEAIARELEWTRARLA
jgi:sugar phosphate isomerase/epimerase